MLILRFWSIEFVSEFINVFRIRNLCEFPRHQSLPSYTINFVKRAIKRHCYINQCISQLNPSKELLGLQFRCTSRQRLIPRCNGESSKVGTRRNWTAAAVQIIIGLIASKRTDNSHCESELARELRIIGLCLAEGEPGDSPRDGEAGLRLANAGIETPFYLSPTNRFGSIKSLLGSRSSMP